MAITNPPYAYDIVGSFLRPEALKQARADFQPPEPSPASN